MVELHKKQCLPNCITFFIQKVEIFYTKSCNNFHQGLVSVRDSEQVEGFDAFAAFIIRMRGW